MRRLDDAYRYRLFKNDQWFDTGPSCGTREQAVEQLVKRLGEDPELTGYIEFRESGDSRFHPVIDNVFIEIREVES